MSELNNKVRKINILCIMLIYFFIIPVLLHSFIQLRFTILLITLLVFTLYCYIRWVMIFEFFNNTKKAFLRFVLEEGSLFIGLILVIVNEGFIYMNSNDYGTPSLRFLLNVVAFCFVYPTHVTNRMITRSKRV